MTEKLTPEHSAQADLIIETFMRELPRVMSTDDEHAKRAIIRLAEVGNDKASCTALMTCLANATGLLIRRAMEVEPDEFVGFEVTAARAPVEGATAIAVLRCAIAAANKDIDAAIDIYWAHSRTPELVSEFFVEQAQLLRSMGQAVNS